MGGLAEGVQTILDLGVLDLAEVAVDFQHELAEVVRLLVDAEVAVKLSLLHHLPDLGFKRRQLGRVQGLALIMLVHELLQFGDVAHRNQQWSWAG